MINSSISGIIFDLDNTLYHADIAYEYALSSLGISPDDNDFILARTLTKNRMGASNPSSRNRLFYFKEMLTKSHRFSAFETLEMITRYENALEENIRKQWNDLKRLHLLEFLSSKFKLLILTNENTRTQLVKLRAMDPHSRIFSHMITSEEVGVEKPHPQMLETAIQFFNKPKNEILMIGDSLNDDVEPAILMGLKAIWTTEFISTSTNNCSPDLLKVSKLDDIRTWLK